MQKTLALQGFSGRLLDMETKEQEQITYGTYSILIKALSVAQVLLEDSDIGVNLKAEWQDSLKKAENKASELFLSRFPKNH